MKLWNILTCKFSIRNNNPQKINSLPCLVQNPETIHQEYSLSQFLVSTSCFPSKVKSILYRLLIFRTSDTNA